MKILIIILVLFITSYTYGITTKINTIVYANTSYIYTLNKNVYGIRISFTADYSCDSYLAFADKDYINDNIMNVKNNFRHNMDFNSTNIYSNIIFVISNTKHERILAVGTITEDIFTDYIILIVIVSIVLCIMIFICCIGSLILCIRIYTNVYKLCIDWCYYKKSEYSYGK